MTGHGTGMAKDYLPTEQHVAYYRERAMGGVGLIGMGSRRFTPPLRMSPASRGPGCPDRPWAAKDHARGARPWCPDGHAAGTRR